MVEKIPAVARQGELLGNQITDNIVRWLFVKLCRTKIIQIDLDLYLSHCAPYISHSKYFIVFRYTTENRPLIKTIPDYTRCAEEGLTADKG